MSDQVVGIAVLQRHQTVPFEGLLYIRCRYSNGDSFDNHIPVHEGQEKVGFWAFTVVGDTAHVHPSVRTQRPPNPEWHNTYSWCVRFQEYDASKFATPATQLREINAPTGERLHD